MPATSLARVAAQLGLVERLGRDDPGPVEQDQGAAVRSVWL
jgi:hypothetical protein